MDKNTLKINIKDVISQNLNSENLQKILGNIDNQEIDSIYRFIDLPIENVYPNPEQPRKTFSDEKLNELANSIKTYGLFTPIMVKKQADKYMIIAGERRFRASKIAGLKTIKAIVCQLSDKAIEEIAIVENVQRENLNAIEEAQAYQKLIQRYHYTQEALAVRVGKSREYVTNIIRLLKLPETAQQSVLKGEISAGHARALLSLKNQDKIPEVILDISNNKLSVRETEKLIKKINSAILKKSKVDISSSNILYENERDFLHKILDAKVRIKDNTIMISFHDENDLKRIINMIKKDCDI